MYCELAYIHVVNNRKASKVSGNKVTISIWIIFRRSVNRSARSTVQSSVHDRCNWFGRWLVFKYLCKMMHTMSEHTAGSGGLGVSVLPFDGMGLFEQQRPRFLFKMPKVVPNQKAKFETEELFRRLSRESEVSWFQVYSPFSDGFARWKRFSFGEKRFGNIELW